MRTKERIAHFKALGVEFFDTMPEGWKELKGATTAPNGYIWIWNLKNPFGKESKNALLKVS